MSDIKLKISFPGDCKTTMEVFEESPGKLVFELYPDDPEGNGGGRAVVDSAAFIEKLNKLLSK
jgi:hypothetical protein